MMDNKIPETRNRAQLSITFNLVIKIGQDCIVFIKTGAYLAEGHL
jgi:hypothetical protein